MSVFIWKAETNFGKQPVLFNNYRNNFLE